MRLSRRAEYAMLAMADLAQHSGEGRVQLREVARRQQIPEKYLEQLLRPLRSAGIIVSARGARGGYQLARPAAEIDLLEVLEAVDGPLTVSAEEPLPSRSSPAVRRLWQDMIESAGARLRAVSVAELAARCRAERADGNDWVI